jgi:hypothetical protein
MAKVAVILHEALTEFRLRRAARKAAALLLRVVVTERVALVALLSPFAATSAVEFPRLDCGCEAGGIVGAMWECVAMLGSLVYRSYLNSIQTIQWMLCFRYVLLRYNDNRNSV